MTKKQQITFGIIAGFVLVLVGLGLVFFGPVCLTDIHIYAIKLSFALGGAAFAAVIPGALNFNNNYITASGALAVFVIVFFLVPQPDSNCNETTVLEGVVYYDNDYFPNASVTITGKNIADAITNTNGHFKFLLAKNIVKANEELEFRISNSLMDIRQFVTQPYTGKLIKIVIKKKETDENTVEIQSETAATIAEEKSDSAPTSTPPKLQQKSRIPLSKPVTIYDYCVECIAKDSLQRIRNVKRKCNRDSLYIENYIIGFSRASQEQSRTVKCTRSKRMINNTN
jgi:hypothetical protein